MAYNFKPRGVYSFDTLAPGVLPASFNNATVLGVIDYEMASSLVDVMAIHVNVRPHLPEGTPDSPEDLDFIQIKQGTEKTVLAIAWINEASIQRRVSLSARALIEDVTADDLLRIREALVSNGFDKIKLELVSQEAAS